MVSVRRENLFIPILLLAIGLVWPFASVIADDVKPLKIIAPDLVIDTVEQGEFLDDPPDPRHFKPSNVVGKHTGLFGWRMKINTTRKTVLVQEKAVKGSANALPFKAVPKFGYIFSAKDIVTGVSSGYYASTIFVENVPVTTLTMVVK